MPFPLVVPFSPMLEAFCRVQQAFYLFRDITSFSASVFFQQKPPASLVLLSRKQLPWEMTFAAVHSANHFCDGFSSAIKMSCSPCTISVSL